MKQVKPVIDILADLILDEPISFLDFPFGLVTPPIDGGKLIIGELAPLLFGKSHELFPVSFDRESQAIALLLICYKEKTIVLRKGPVLAVIRNTLTTPRVEGQVRCGKDCQKEEHLPKPTLERWGSKFVPPQNALQWGIISFLAFRLD